MPNEHPVGYLKQSLKAIFCFWKVKISCIAILRLAVNPDQY